MKRINLGKIIRKTMDKFYMEYEKYSVSYPESDIFAIGDGKYIKRVLDNFVSNAFKYTPEKGEISVEVVEEKEIFRVDVSNTCDSITEEELNEVWTPFYRGDKSRSSEGTGLGLAIVKGILDKHGSDYGAYLKDGKVVFWFTLKKFRE